MRVARTRPLRAMWLAPLCVALGLLALSGAAAASSATLAEGGWAAMPVVTGPEAPAAVRDVADELGDYLGRITGGTFERTQGDGARGIVIGRPEDFTALPFEIAFGSGLFDRDDYLLRSTDNAVYLLGSTTHAVHNAMWDLLYRFGHRQFFPTDIWEVVPEKPTLAIAIDEDQRPDFHSRRFGHGGHWNRSLHDRWQVRNRTQTAFRLHSGHAWSGIIRRNRDTFDANPEFLALVNGERGGGRGNKFCISNPQLRELVVQDAVTNRVDEDTDTISMEPTDGGDWCECAECQAMGTITDRVVILANEVAAAINELGLGEKYVGIYAYNQHSPPPSPHIEVHPNVIVSISTRFIRGGYGMDDLFEGWAPRVNMLGIREHYYGYRNLPGAGRAADIAYLKRTIPRFHAAGARFLNVNIHGSWGHAGLGHYLISRYTWDVSAVERTDELVDDFLRKAFGDASEPMRWFYKLMHRFDEDDRRPIVSEDLVARMYRFLQDARSRTDDEAIMRRLDDMTLYTRHVELFHQIANTSGDEAQALYREWLRHAYRFGDHLLLQTRWMHGRLYRPPGVSIKDRAWRNREVEAAEPYTPEQIAQFVIDGVANNQKADFEPVAFSDDLVPAARYLDLPDDKSEGRYGNANRHRQSRSFLLWVDEPGEIRLRVTGGISYQDRGNVRLELISMENELEGEVIDQDDSVPPDQEAHEVVLHTSFTGLHVLEATHGGARFLVEFPEDMPVSHETGFRPHVGLTLYFYVPRGTEVVGGYVNSRYHGIYDGDGNKVFSFEDDVSRGLFSVPVPEGQDGRVWQVRTWRGTGVVRLKTAPPYLATSPRKLLLPREVVEADAP